MNVAFRVDASTDMGTGHLMRCLTLADAVARRGGRVRFVSRSLPETLRAIVVERGHDLALLAGTSGPLDELPYSAWLGTSQRIDAEETRRALADADWARLVVDHYAIDARWHRALREVCGTIIVIDDLANREHDCDVLIDQNLHDNAHARYERLVPAHCRLLLGPRYAMLRDEFRAHRPTKGREVTVRRILIAFGGVDGSDLTTRAIEAAADLGLAEAQVDVVIGAQHHSRERIEAECDRLGYGCHVQTKRIAELMAAADLAIGAGGSALWERCCMGLPALALLAAENQRAQLDEAAAHGLVYAPERTSDAGTHIAMHLRSLLANPGLRRAISRKGMQAVDGLGAQRVLRALGLTRIAMREATAADSVRLFQWRNAPEVRRVSRNAEPIDRAVHEEWFRSVLADRNRILLMGECADGAVGVVRFDVEGTEAEVSIYLVPNHTEPGTGSELLVAAEQWLARERKDVLSVKAEVLGDNERSHRLFRSNGYLASSTVYRKQVVIQ
jgi:UDP-2,4-diacetamido-2,4,6-trideoxy-beta-L-altropyranose hydrolase